MTLSTTHQRRYNDCLTRWHPDPTGEAKRQLKRLTADELRELHRALDELNTIVTRCQLEPPTEIDTDIDHAAMVRNGQLAEVSSHHRAKQEPARFSKR